MNLLDTLLGSKELKKILVERSFAMNLPFKYLCEEALIDYASFMGSYINSSDGSKNDITEDQFVKILEMVGINVRFQFVIDNNYDGKELSKKLIDKHELRKEKKRLFNKI